MYRPDGSECSLVRKYIYSRGKRVDSRFCAFLSNEYKFSDFVLAYCGEIDFCEELIRKQIEPHQAHISQISRETSMLPSR